MHCKDLLSMEQLKDSLHLVAGEQGLGRFEIGRAYARYDAAV